MPIYEYQCDKCRHQFEYLVLPTTESPACPKCKGRKLSRLVSLCAVNSETSMKQHLRKEQRKNRKVAQGKEYEERKAIIDHDK